MAKYELFEEVLTGSVIGAFYDVYNTLRFGFLEHIYLLALERELLARGHRVARETGVRVMYKGVELGIQRLDMIVDEKLVIEVKATTELHKSALRQLRSYLRATNLEIGLLLHFGPQAKPYRLTCRNHDHTSEQDPEDPPDPMDPPNPSSVEPPEVVRRVFLRSS
jgi:GxxExxY protein